MTFRLGVSKLSYDFFGTWKKRLEASVEVPDAIIGDPSWPGSLQPGCFMLCDEPRIVQVKVTL